MEKFSLWGCKILSFSQDVQEVIINCPGKISTFVLAVKTDYKLMEQKKAKQPLIHGIRHTYIKSPQSLKTKVNIWLILNPTITIIFTVLNKLVWEYFGNVFSLHLQQEVCYNSYEVGASQDEK